ncbi:unnamed protein product [Musa banksii]
MFCEVGEPWPVLIPDEEIHLSFPGTKLRVSFSFFFYFLSKAFLHTGPVRLVDLSYNPIEISIPPHLRLRDLPLRLLERCWKSPSSVSLYKFITTRNVNTCRTLL